MKKNLLYIVLIATLALALVGIHPSEAQVSTGSLTTTFVGGNGCYGSMFDITVVGADDVTITGFDQNIWSGAPGTVPVNVYYKAGSYVGSETNAAAWTLLGSANVTNLGDGNPSVVPVGGLTIPAGQTYGLYIDVTVGGNNYTNGANTYANTEVQIDTGVGLCGTFSSVNNPRTWNGTVYYEYGSAVVPVAGINVPQLGMVKIDAWAPTAAYSSPGGEVVRHSGGDLYLPHDADQNGFDTYVVTETAIVDGKWWVALFIGNETWVWVRYDAVQPLSSLSFE